MKFLASPIGIAVLALMLYVGTSAALLSRQTFVIPVQRKPDEAAKKAVLVWDASSPEVDQMITTLRKEKEALEHRSKELDDLAEKLAQQRTEMNQATQLVQRLQTELEQNLVRVRQEEGQNLKRLAKVYSAMSPDGAAAIFKNMQDEQIVKVMVFMKDGETGPIIEAFSKLGESESKRAAMISDKVRVSIRDKAEAKNPRS